MDDRPPKVDNAPGLVWRKRKTAWLAVWQPRTDLVRRGYDSRTSKLWRGEEPSPAHRDYISHMCNRLQQAMLIWSREGITETTPFYGTLSSLSDSYQNDPDSNFKTLRYHTRQYYGILLRRIERDHGTEKVKDIRARHLKRWHAEWTEASGVSMAHALMGMLRTLATFGATILECEDCRALKITAHDMRFKMAKPRSEQLQAEQVIAIRAEAHRQDRRSLAWAQAIQFDCMLRQRDVIGEYVPRDEPGTSEVLSGQDKWLRGIRWNEIDENLILRHTTSKRQKDVEIDLKLCPMVMEEWSAAYPGLVVVNEMTMAVTVNRGLLPASGPIIVSEITGVPWRASEFRRIWRKTATAVGVPKTVRNMDSRAGAISEATDAGADLESVRHAATHADIAMTQRYSRNSVEKTATVLKLRAAHREQKAK